MIWWIIGTAVLVLLLFVIYDVGEIKEIHKMRASFDIEKHLIQDKLRTEENRDHKKELMSKLQEVETLLAFLQMEEEKVVIKNLFK